MAGYKDTVKDDGAKGFWTFDGDAFDPVTRKLIVGGGQPNYIIDEIDNSNPAILHSDNETYLGYRMGMPSMIEHEQEGQYSISFGYYGAQPSHPDIYAKSFLEIPHSADFSFTSGEFTVEFLMNKQADPDVPGINLTRPIISKDLVFNIYITDSEFGPDYIKIDHPGGTITRRWDSDPTFGVTMWDKTVHVVLSWKLTDLGGGAYSGVVKLYLNSTVVHEESFDYLDETPNINVASPIFVAGDPTENDIELDRHTNDFTIDAIAIYDRALTDLEVTSHYKKVYPYNRMIEESFVDEYWRLNDNDSLSDFTAYAEIGSIDGEYIGERGTQITREQSPPEQILSGSSTRFTNGGMLAIENIAGVAYQERAINYDYSYEWWFKTPELDRAVMLAMTEMKYPFNGFLFQLNVQNDEFVNGMLQFTETLSGNDYVFNTLLTNGVGDRVYLNSDEWHHCCITREGTLVSYYIDAILQDSYETPTKEIGLPGQLYLMNSYPGNQPMTGSLCELASYRYALQPHQIMARFAYAETYRIRGVVTLLGVPYQAILRFYDHHTGELIQQKQSDPITGEYEAYFFNDKFIDILVFDAFDLSVRYRAYGPVTPSQIDDLPIVV
jgi:hypothetical protein